MIKIELDNRQVIEALDRLIQAGTDMAPVFQDIGEYLVDSTKQRFASGTAPDGSPWAPLSPVTVARKGHGQPLIGESRRLSNEIFSLATAEDVAVGSPLEYAATQHYGASRGAFGQTRRGSPIPWGNIPAREIVGLSDHDEVQVLDILSEHLEAAV